MNEDKKVILNHEQQTLNNFIIFQNKFLNKIGDEEYDNFKRKYSKDNYIVPILFGILIFLYLLFHESHTFNDIIFSILILTLFVLCLVIKKNDTDASLRNIYNAHAYQKVIDLIEIAKENEITEQRAAIDFAEYCRISNKYNNIANFFKENYLFTPIFRKICIETKKDKEHSDIISASIISKGYCMCCGECGAKKLSKKKNDYLLCDLCFEKE